MSEKYDNLKTIMSFECPSGHQVFDTWDNLRDNRMCPTCARNILKNTNNGVVPKSRGTTRILALDQATRISGWAVYDNNNLIKYGIFETNLDDEIARCHQIKIWLQSMIAHWKPDIIGLEDIQF